MKRKWWLILVAVIVALLVTAAFFWQTLLLYFAPNLILAGALKDRISELEARFSVSPISVLARGIDPAGRNQADLQLMVSNERIGTIQYDMNLQMEQKPKRILAAGNVTFQNTTMDLSLYLDKDFAAVSSKGILAGNFYGLTYDTFSQDIRANKWISMLVGESVLQSWETKVNSLQDIMRDTVVISDISGTNVKNLAMGILALDADVERISVDTNGSKEVYHVISYETTGQEIATGLEYLDMKLPAGLTPDDDVEISFWMQEGQICKIEIEAEGREVDIFWGIAPISTVSPDDIYVQYFENGNVQTLHVHSEQHEDMLQENIIYTNNEKTEISYSWNAISGDLSMNVEAKGEGHLLAMKLMPAENGFSVQTEDFGALLHLLTGTHAFQHSSCTMTVSRGSAFETPDYKNFTNCSLEDLLTLLSGIGSLIGINLS